MRKILLLSVLAGVLACSPRQGASPTASPRPSGTSPSSAEYASGCPNEGDAIGKELREGSTSEYDLDGDGAPEEILVARDPQGDPGCQAFLAVTGDAFNSLVAPLDDELSFELGLPSVSGVAEVDGVPPKEIIVDIASGASTAFAGVFSVQDGRLVRRMVEGDTPYGRLFPYGGSVGHLEGSDCSGIGTIVISVAMPRGKGYLVHRRFFESEGDAFVFDPSRSEKEVVPPGALDGLAELSGAAFSSCPR